MKEFKSLAKLHNIPNFKEGYKEYLKYKDTLPATSDKMVSLYKYTFFYLFYKLRVKKRIFYKPFKYDLAMCVYKEVAECSFWNKKEEEYLICNLYSVFN